jgi:uncharacterized membrane protein
VGPIFNWLLFGYGVPAAGVSVELAAAPAARAISSAVFSRRRKTSPAATSVKANTRPSATRAPGPNQPCSIE